MCCVHGVFYVVVYIIHPVYVLSPCKGRRLALIRLYEFITVLLTEILSYVNKIGQPAV